MVVVGLIVVVVDLLIITFDGAVVVDLVVVVVVFEITLAANITPIINAAETSRNGKLAFIAPMQSHICFK